MLRRLASVKASVETVASSMASVLVLLEQMQQQIVEVRSKNLENEDRLRELRDLVIRLDESKSTLIAQHIAGVVDGVSMSVGSQISSQVERLQADLADARQQIIGTLHKG